MTLYLPENVRRVLDGLTAAGHDCYAVGGCVRDLLRGAEPTDYDITTSALPHETKALFERLGCRVAETGLRHGTVTVIWQGQPYEITTFRMETGYSDHRRPDRVDFTKDVTEDLARRDFTVNAMAYHPDKGLIDPYGGREDLKNGILRCVGDPARRFDEDALRILRAFRFASALGLTVEPGTYEAAVKKAETLRYVSAERIFAELKKLLCGRDAGRILPDMRPILNAILPEVAEWDDEQYRMSVSFVAAAPKEPILRLAALFSAAPDRATGALKQLKSDNDTSRTVVWLVSKLWEPIPTDGAAIKRLMQQADRLPKGIFSLLDLQRACRPEERGAIEQVRQTVKQVLAEGEVYLPKQLNIDGTAVAEFVSGPAVGQVLKRLYEEVITGATPNEPAALRERAREMTNVKTLRTVWEHNGDDTILYAADYPGAFTRGESLSVAKGKMADEMASYAAWLGLSLPPVQEIEVTQDAPCGLAVRDADSAVLFDGEKEPLTYAEYEQLKAVALKAASDFNILYSAIPDKSAELVPSRSTFYGAVPRTAEEMYRHTKSVNSYYFAEIGVAADNDGDILSCRSRGFAALEEQEGFLSNPMYDGSYGECWTLRKVLRRFIWHDRIHAKAMYRRAVQRWGKDGIPDPFCFDRLSLK